MDIREATEKWVDGFNSIPLSLIVKAYQDNIDDMWELTPIFYICTDCGGEFSEYEENGCPLCGSSDFSEIEHDSWLPMWGIMWTFSNRLDEEWARDNLDEMARCGFRIFESDELGIFFGIDGAGYNFYEAHWIPLYKARGLQWHDRRETA